MQSLLVRPVMTGLLALIIAGFWGLPQGRYGFTPVSITACHAASAAQPMGLAARRAGRC